MLCYGFCCYVVDLVWYVSVRSFPYGSVVGVWCMLWGLFVDLRLCLSDGDVVYLLRCGMLLYCSWLVY